jgi:DnaJ-class molecular chaperone
MEIESLADITLLELKQQYRKLQHKNHPDKGGSIRASQSVLQAYSQLHKYISVNS